MSLLEVINLPWLQALEADKADRFLLAVLQTQGILEAMTKAEVRRHLRNLTQDLGQAFQNSLQRISQQAENRKHTAICTLMWVSRTLRPLLVHDLCHLLATEIGEASLDEDAILKPKQILESCLGLIYIDESNSQVRLVHLALQEYLQKEKLSVGEALDADTYMTKTLLTYICLDGSVQGIDNSVFLGQGKRLSQTLYAYALLNWGFHARLASSVAIKSLALNYLHRQDLHDQDITRLIGCTTRSTKTWPSSSSAVLNRYPHKGTGLHIAAAFGLSELLSDLLDTGAKVGCIDSNGNAALHFAAANGHLAAVSVLLKRRAETTPQNRQWRTPLYEAVVNSHETVVLKLLNHGAMVEVECDDRWSPLHKAVDNGDLNIVRILLKRGASVTAISMRGLIPLHRAAGRGFVALMEDLLAAGSPIDWKTTDGWSPLHGACNSGHHEAARLLISRGADINLRNREGRTPLHRACRSGHYLTVFTLLQHGANIGCKDRSDNTPLHRAAKGGHILVSDLLLDQPQPPVATQLLARNKENQTPRQHSAHQGQWRMADSLRLKEEKHNINDSSKISDYELAIKANDLPRLSSLLANGADVSQRTSDEFTLLHLTLLLENEAMAYFLMSFPGIDLDARTTDGWQPLHCAANTGNSNLVRLCLEYGADVSSLTYGGLTPLHKACRSGSLECVRLLLEAGASVEIADNWGWTPLHKAALAGSMPIVELLIEHNADINARTNKKTTPQICANEAGHWTLSQFFRQLRHDRKSNPNSSAVKQFSHPLGEPPPCID